MKLFLVRHGESTYNAKKMHQDAGVPLSESGKSQARFVAERFTNIPIDLIVSSDFERAKQTAQIISQTIKKDVTFSPLFREVKRPTEIEGRYAEDADVLAIKNLINDNSHNPNWKYSDEESFYEVKQRALDALEYVQSCNKENVLAVSHGEFIRMLFGTLFLGDAFLPNHLHAIKSFLSLSNSGITVFEYTDSWRLVTWNDFKHLGES